MTTYEIIVGSMLGASEYVAEAVADSLKSKDATSRVHLQPQLEELDPANPWIICTSTHGAGELPDNIQAFAKQLGTAQLPDTQYLLIGLGDSSYDTFCHGAKQMQQLMEKAGATSLIEPLFIDVLQSPIPEDEAVAWLEKNLA